MGQGPDVKINVRPRRKDTCKAQKLILSVLFLLGQGPDVKINEPHLLAAGLRAATGLVQSIYESLTKRARAVGASYVASIKKFNLLTVAAAAAAAAAAAKKNDTGVKNFNLLAAGLGAAAAVILEVKLRYECHCQMDKTDKIKTGGVAVKACTFGFARKDAFCTMQLGNVTKKTNKILVWAAHRYARM